MGKIGDEAVSFMGIIVYVTPKARLVYIEMGPGEVWVPKSQCYFMGEPDENGEIEFHVSKWWADKNGVS